MKKIHYQAELRVKVDYNIMFASLKNVYSDFDICLYKTRRWLKEDNYCASNWYIYYIINKTIKKL